MKKFYLLAISLCLVFSLSGCQLKKIDEKTAGKISVISIDQAKKVGDEFLNNYLVPEGQGKVTIKDITDENGLYKFKITLPDASEHEFYLSKDGKMFTTQIYDIEKTKTDVKSERNAQKVAAEKEQAAMVKNAKPKVELFVMSHCPFGLQIEKGISPVLEALGDKIEFELKYADYVMHGQQEMDEQINQYCVQKEQKSKFNAYLKCFTEDGNTARCLTQVGIDSAMLDKCVAATDQQFEISKKFNNKSLWRTETFPPFDINRQDVEKYAVKGSPTLIINGKEVASNRDPQSLLKNVCAGFDKEPTECTKTLDTAEPSSGFGAGATASGNTGGANCATN